MFILLNILWLAVISKYILLWIYLWQLKDYLVRRFLDHFRTHKARKLFFNFILLFKIVLISVFLLSAQLFSVAFSFLILLYFAEFSIFLSRIFVDKIKIPSKTKKALFLIAVSFGVAVLFLMFVSLTFKEAPQVPVWLLAFDILIPLIISAIVLLFQPFTVLIKKSILKKAAQKIENIKSVYGKLIVVGITGSYGKTSTKEFLATILSKKFKVLKTKEHQNTELGVAKCVLDELKKDHQIFVVEMGSYTKGGIKSLCNIVKPEIGIVAGVNEQHVALFGSLENLLSAEGGRELAGSLRKNGLLVVNGENKYCLDLYKKADLPSGAMKKIYSLNRERVNSDIWTENITVNKESLSFIAMAKNKALAHFKVSVLGQQNIQNLLAAILVAKELGMSFEEIADACKLIKQEQAGIILKKGKHGINIIDSSYSSNPDGVKADLNYLNVFDAKKVIVMPCIIELGRRSSEIHEALGRKIGKICDFCIITTKEKFDNIKRGAIDSGMEKKNIIFCENPEDIQALLTLFCKKGDAVLLEGRVPEKLNKLLVNS